MHYNPPYQILGSWFCPVAAHDANELATSLFTTKQTMPKARVWNINIWLCCTRKWILNLAVISLLLRSCSNIEAFVTLLSGTKNLEQHPIRNHVVQLVGQSDEGVWRHRPSSSHVASRPCRRDELVAGASVPSSTVPSSPCFDWRQHTSTDCCVTRQRMPPTTTQIITHKHSSAILHQELATANWWLGGITVRASDLRSGSRGFDSQSGRYQAT